MRLKRGKDSYWKVGKYQGDVAWYARCKCGFQYRCSSNLRNEDGTWSFKQYISTLYPYCPNCGARKKWYNEELVDFKEINI